MIDQLITPDFRLQNEGTIAVLYPENDAAREWLDENSYSDENTPTWWGGGIVIEHRYVLDIAEGIVRCGLTIE
jgi:hypothetical protein